MIDQQLRQLQRILIRGQRPLRNLELQVQLAQCEISGGDIGYQRIHHFLSRPVFSQKLVSRCPGGAAVLAPEIQVPLETQTELQVTRIVGPQELGL